MSERKGTFIEIEKSLYEGIKEYCDFNNLKPTSFINELLQKAFMVEKYGEAPSIFLKKKKVTEDVVEKPIDVPVTQVEEPEEPKIINVRGTKKKIKTY